MILINIIQNTNSILGFEVFLSLIFLMIVIRQIFDIDFTQKTIVLTVIGSLLICSIALSFLCQKIDIMKYKKYNEIAQMTIKSGETNSTNKDIREIINLYIECGMLYNNLTNNYGKSRN